MKGYPAAGSSSPAAAEEQRGTAQERRAAPPAARRCGRAAGSSPSRRRGRRRGRAGRTRPRPRPPSGSAPPGGAGRRSRRWGSISATAGSAGRPAGTPPEAVRGEDHRRLGRAPAGSRGGRPGSRWSTGRSAASEAQASAATSTPRLPGGQRDRDHVAAPQPARLAASLTLSTLTDSTMSPDDGVPQPPEWTSHGEFSDIRYETAEGIAKLTINRPEVRNAFRPTTLFELSRAFEMARDDPEVGVVVLTGEGDRGLLLGRRPADPRRRRLSRRPRGRAASTSSTSRSRSGACPSR